jgi:hypothetical protein
MSIAAVSDLRSFFSSAVRDACGRCALSVDDRTADYLGALLSEQARSSERGSVVVALERALSLDPSLQRTALRSVGDSSLYRSGFLQHPEHAVFRRCGVFAYDRASKLSCEQDEAALMRALSARFDELSSVLTEVAIAQSLGAATRDLVRLFDAYRRSRSPSALEAMAREGVFPAADDGEA